VIARVSRGLGEAMVGIEIDVIPPEQRYSERRLVSLPDELARPALSRWVRRTSSVCARGAGILMPPSSVSSRCRVTCSSMSVRSRPSGCEPVSGADARSELADVVALVLPGGESTAISRLLGHGGLAEPLAERIAPACRCSGRAPG
jgi:hypothetical protein